EEEIAGVQSGSIILVGRVFRQREELLLEKEEFRVRQVLKQAKGMEEWFEGSLCALVLSASEAQKSRMTLGYSYLDFRVAKNADEERLQELDHTVTMLAAASQGGSMFSSLAEQREQALYRYYAAFMGSTMFIFSVIAVISFTFTHYYVNWEKNRYAYGIFRSMGMSYQVLQRKLLVQYVTGFIFSFLFSCFVVKEGFGYRFTKGQAALCGAFLMLITAGCHAILYQTYKKVKICDMLRSR
ncbi:MAG: hypothetical protein K2N43_05050, partial [Lachnospiraceae bacterium]|nr:hypothetical protein [Lachnospiraceae bacterium]